MSNSLQVSSAITSDIRPEMHRKLLSLVVSANGKTLMLVRDVEKLVPQREMRDSLEGIWDIKSAKGVDDHKIIWRDRCTAATQLHEGLSKTSTKLKGYLEQIRRRAVSKQLEESRETLKIAVTNENKKAAQLAEEIKISKTSFPLFDMGFAERADLGVMAVPNESEAGGACNTSIPFIVRGLAKDWTGLKNIAYAMTSFGGQDLNDETAKKEGKGQLPLLTREGKEETINMLAAACASHVIPAVELPAMDQTLVSSTSTVLLWGYKENHTCAALPRLGLAQLRTINVGKVVHIFFEIASVLQAFPKLTIESVNDLLALDARSLKEAIDRGLKCWQVEANGNSMLYTPVGYLVAEVALEQVNYGIRKGIFMKSAKYESVVNLAKRETTKAAKKIIEMAPAVLE